MMLVRQPTDEIPPHRGILSVAAPAGAHVEALVELRQQHRNVVRVVLQIGIHRNDDLARREVESCLHRGGLAEVAAEVNDLERRLRRRDLVEQRRRVVRAAVVDEYHFPGVRQLRERGDEAIAQPRQALLFVENRDGNGNEAEFAERRMGFVHRALPITNRTGCCVQERARGAFSHESGPTVLQMPPIACNTPASAGSAICLRTRHYAHHA